MGGWEVPTQVWSSPASLCRADFVQWLHKTHGESTEEPPVASEPEPPSELQGSLLQFLDAKKVMGSTGEGMRYSNLLLHILR